MKTLICLILAFLALFFQQGHAISFVAVGDLSCNHESIKTLRSIVSKKLPTVVLGDIGYDDNTQCVLSYLKQIEQVYFVRGNHDGNDSWRLTREYFKLPDNGLWSKKINDTLFVGMNSLKDWRTQYDFVKKALDVESKWKFVLIHAPVLKSVCGNRDPHTASMCGFYDLYHPLFSKMKVNCVLQAHMHTFSFYSSGEICYPIIGNGGAEPYQNTEFQNEIYESAVHGFTVINGNKINLFDNNGTNVKSFTFR